MIAWISSVLTARSTPLTISVPSSSATCRFLSSSNAKLVLSSPVVGSRKRRRFVTHGSDRSPAPAKRRYPQGVPFGISWWEVLILGLIILLIFGPKRLPEMGRQLGRGMREFKESITGSGKGDEDV